MGTDKLEKKISSQLLDLFNALENESFHLSEVIDDAPTIIYSDLVSGKISEVDYKKISRYYGGIKELNPLNTLKKQYLINRELFNELMLATLEEQAQENPLVQDLFKAYQSKLYYLESIHTFLMYMFLWIKTLNNKDLLSQCSKLYKAAVLGTLGYRILDLHFDEGKAKSEEVLLGLSLIDKHETLLYNVFGFNLENHRLVQGLKNEYLRTEMKEQSFRNMKCPYEYENPVECAFKATHLFTPLALILLNQGMIDKLNDYKRIFYLSFACMQIVDDISDLDEDVLNGHFSLPTLGFESELINHRPKSVRDFIVSKTEVIEKIYNLSLDMLTEAREIATEKLDDNVFMLSIEGTRLNFNKYFLQIKELNFRLNNI